MFIVTKENIIPYIKKHMPDFDDTAPATVTVMGEDPNADEGEKDGHINFVFKIKTPSGSYVLNKDCPTQEIFLPRHRLPSLPTATKRSATRCGFFKISCRSMYLVFYSRTVKITYS